MSNSRKCFKGKVLNPDPMVTPSDGWVNGFYYQDLCRGKIKHFIHNSEMTWEVIPESISNKTTLIIPDREGKMGSVYEGDILAVYSTKWGWNEYIVGWDEKGFQLGMCPLLIYLDDRPGAKDGFVGRELRVSLTRDFIRRIPYHIYDVIQEKKKDEYCQAWFDIREMIKEIEIPQNWEPIIKLI